MSPPFVPERGDVVRIAFDPQAGHEQQGRRPALVLSPASYNSKVGLALVCPITGQGKGYAWEVKIPGGLPVYGVILSDQLKSLDWNVRNATYLCTLDPVLVADVVNRALILLLPDAP